MAKFNVRTAKPAAARGPITAEATPSGETYEGAPGYARDVKSELFLLAVSNFVGEDSFYEKAGDRDNRFRTLVREAAVVDPDWAAGLIRWLRHDANMRSASIIAAAEYAWARRDEAGTGRTGTVHPEPTVTTRKVIDSVLVRADEPGELLAYWTSRYGKNIPMPVKRGVGDAMLRLGSEFNIVKYGDSAARGFTFADVLNLVHPGDWEKGRQTFAGDWQRDLFAYATKKAYQPDLPIPGNLGLLTRRQALLSLPVADRRNVLDNPDTLRRAGITWEQLAGWLQGPMDKEAWEAIIPSMGYMALIRNLRNFDEAGVSDEVASWVVGKMTDPEQVAQSRQFPYRFLAAYEQAPSLRWGSPLDKALQLSLGNLPAMTGRSLVLVDTSSSMILFGFSRRSKMTPMKAAAVFGVALAARNDADLYGFATGQFRHDVPKGASVIREVDRFCNRSGEVGHGTEIAKAITATYEGHARVFVCTDEQTFGPGRGGSYDSHGNVTDAAPHNVPIYVVNLAGYQHSMLDAGAPNRHELGSLGDHFFKMIPLIEQGKSATWPWLEAR